MIYYAAMNEQRLLLLVVRRFFTAQVDFSKHHSFKIPIRKKTVLLPKRCDYVSFEINKIFVKYSSFFLSKWEKYFRFIVNIQKNGIRKINFVPFFFCCSKMRDFLIGNTTPCVVCFMTVTSNDAQRLQ